MNSNSATRSRPAVALWRSGSVTEFSRLGKATWGGGLRRRDPPEIPAAAERHGFVAVSALNQLLPYRRDGFDYAVALDVFEHLPGRGNSADPKHNESRSKTGGNLDHSRTQRTVSFRRATTSMATPPTPTSSLRQRWPNGRSPLNYVFTPSATRPEFRRELTLCADSPNISSLRSETARTKQSRQSMASRLARWIQT